MYNIPIDGTASFMCNRSSISSILAESYKSKPNRGRFESSWDPLGEGIIKKGDERDETGVDCERVGNCAIGRGEGGGGGGGGAKILGEGEVVCSMLFCSLCCGFGTFPSVLN